jgi:hypothetical protein
MNWKLAVLFGGRRIGSLAPSFAKGIDRRAV